jgi:hypothetical protein
MDRVDPVIQWTTLALQVWILVTVAWSVWYAWRTQKATRATLDALIVYRREVEWMTARLEALEKKGQGNGRVENGRGR